jgi:hydroxypyruvate isomerase
MRKLIVMLLEGLALATGVVTVAAVNPQTTEMMVAASEAANQEGQSAIRKIIVFAQAAGNVAMLTVHPQSATAWPQQRPVPSERPRAYGPADAR